MANTPQPFATARLKVWAEIETMTGLVKIGNEERGGDIVSVSATFALNTIPTATLVLATGLNAITNEPATIHRVKDRLKPRDKVKVYVKIIPGIDGVAAKVHPGKYKIFEGYLAGIGYQRSHNQANYVLNLIHWLDDLNNSSAINGDWLPGAPSDWARAALIATVGTVTATSPVPNISADLANTKNVTDDLWEKTIKPICLKLAGFTGNKKQLSAPEPEANLAAIAALDRMPGNGKAKYYKALKWRAPTDASLNFSTALANYFRAAMGDSTSQNSFWAKIISEFAADFMFAVSPAVDWALPIPFCAGLRWRDGGKVIEASDYSYANFNTNMAQMLEAVFIVHPVVSGTNLQAEKSRSVADQAISFFYPYGSYPDANTLKKLTTEEKKRGLKLFKTPPSWMAGISPAALAGLSSVTSSQLVSAGGPGNTTLPKAVDTMLNALKNSNATMMAFAKHWYLTEILQQRVGELSGPLRFDIAPGSIVKIVTPARDIATVQAPLLAQDGSFVVASIMSVSYVINSERATAGTSFTIAHTKTKTENDPDPLFDRYSTAGPPLYGEDRAAPETFAFYDAPLAEQE